MSMEQQLLKDLKKRGLPEPQSGVIKYMMNICNEWKMSVDDFLDNWEGYAYQTKEAISEESMRKFREKNKDVSIAILHVSSASSPSPSIPSPSLSQSFPP